MPHTRVDTIVTGGSVATASGSVKTSIAIHGGRVVALGPAEMLPDADKTIDAKGMYVLPGLIMLITISAGGKTINSPVAWRPNPASRQSFRSASRITPGMNRCPTPSPDSVRRSTPGRS